MSMRIFDTNVLIDYLKNKPEAVDFLKQCVREGDQLACSVITFAELLTGIRPGEKEVIMRFLHAFEALDITCEIALLAGAYLCKYRVKTLFPLLMPCLLRRQTSTKRHFQHWTQSIFRCLIST